MKLLSAVIDSHSKNALIAAAHAEGLLHASRETDGVFESICEKPVDYRIRQQLLEQLVLTPTLAFHGMGEWLWEALDGPLKDEGRIVNLGNAKSDFSAGVESLSLDIIAGLVRAAGHSIHPSQFEPLRIAALNAYKEEEKYVTQSGREAPSLMEKQITDMLNRTGFLEIPYDYSEEEYKAQRRRNEHYKAFEPIANAMAEYIRVAQLAAKHDMVIKTPQFSDAGQTQIINPDFVRGTEADELVLFRIVAQQLGKTTFRPTIKGSLELAYDPATIALREQLNLWQSALPEGNEIDLKLIQKEISQAQRAISRLSGVEKIGTITTWLSVPVAVAEMILTLQPVLGITIGIAGKISSARAIAVTRKHKWAMFGNTQ